MDQHAQRSETPGLPVYLRDPHSHWQRPGNDNTIGLFPRRFFRNTGQGRYSRET